MCIQDNAPQVSDEYDCMQLMSPARSMRALITLTRCLLLLLLLVPTIGSAAPALGPQPVWHYPSATTRQIMPAPITGSESLLVAMPLPAGIKHLTDLRTAAIHADGHPLSSQPLALDGRNAWVRVAIPKGAPTDRKGLCAVYLGTLGDQLPAPSKAANSEPTVALSLNLLPDRSYPKSWSLMKTLRAKPRAKHQQRHLGSAIVASQWRDHHIRTQDSKKQLRRSSMARLKSVIIPPAAGAYRFALRSSTPSFLLIDGQLVLTSNRHDQRNEWVLGDPVMLSTKPVQIEVVSVALPTLDITAGWLPPDAAEDATPREIPASAYAAIALPVTTHTEEQSQPLYVDFTYTHQRPYRFRDSDAVFSTVAFAGLDYNWLKAPVRYQWQLNDETLKSTARNFKQRLNTSNPSLVTLTLRDTLGFTNSVTRKISPSPETPREYAVDAEMGNLPPACYPTDIVHPVLLVNGKVDRHIPLTATWHLTGPGLDHRAEKKLPALKRQRIDIPLGRHQAADLTRIDWSITHDNTAIAQGIVHFTRPPFATTPQTAVGGSLFDAAGDQLVLVANQYADRYQQPPITTKQAFGRISCLDDFICPGSTGTHATDFPAVLARIIDGADHPQVNFHTLPHASDMQHLAYQPLLKLVQAPLLSKGSDVVVLSLARRDMRDLASPARYERYAAALTDLLSATLGYRVVWFTPPPFGGADTTTRPYAAAIRRVADGRHVPVADLYSAGTILGQQSRLFSDAAAHSLSPQGQALAAELCARALLANPQISRTSRFKRSQP